MDTSNERCWSFCYEIESARYSFEVVAPSREIAESVVRTAECEGAIAPVSNAFAVPQSGAAACKA